MATGFLLLFILSNSFQSDIIENHANFKKTMHLLNDAIGSVSFVFAICALPFYCEIFVDFFDTARTFQTIRIIIYFVYFTGALTLAAEGHKMVNFMSYGNPKAN